MGKPLPTEQENAEAQQELRTSTTDGPNCGPKPTRKRLANPRLDSVGPRAVHGPVAWRINIYGVGERRGLTACRLAGSCVTAAAAGSVAPPPSTPIGGWCRWCSGAKARTFKPVECSTLHRVCITFSVGCRHQNCPASRAVVATNRQLRSRAAGGFCLPASRS